MFCECACSSPHLRGVDSSLLEGAVVGILRAHVAILAPVTGKVSINTGEAPGAGENVRDRGGKIGGLMLFEAIKTHTKKSFYLPSSCGLQFDICMMKFNILTIQTQNEQLNSLSPSQSENFHLLNMITL